MKFKYRFKGKVNSQFVLRGMLFSVNSKIDFCVSDNELDFVKKHCDILEIIDLEEIKTVETPNTVLEETKTENKVKEVKNGLQSKPNGSANKSQHKKKV